MTERHSIAWVLTILVAAGCSKTADVQPRDGEEAAVRAAVTALQEAIKAKDAARLWDLLDAKSQTDADQAAAAVQALARRADAASKAELEKAYGLPAAELEALTGQGFLKTASFEKKYGELPASAIDKVSVLGKQATVSYTEPDGDKEKITLILRDGKWKAVLPMPKEKP
jgi:hypothetical protein